MERRDFIKSLILFNLSVLLPWKKAEINLNAKSLIRPPGALTEEDFIDRCIRCGECLKVCPAKCLKSVSLKEGICEWLTPHIIPRESGCIRCLNCGKVCPSGAIQKVEVEEVKIGTAGIEKEMCLVWTKKKECLVCREYCPVGAVSIDFKGRPIVEPDVCVGCGVCEENCPVLGEKAAIKVSPEGEKRYYLKERKYR